MNTVNPFENRLYMQNSQIFLPGNEHAYCEWRERKLSALPSQSDLNIVMIGNLARPDNGEIGEILRQCSKNNLAIYQLKNVPEISGNDDSGQKRFRGDLSRFCSHLGLVDAEMHRSRGDDGVVAIEVNNNGIGAGYIPYSDKPLSWHTDGYYNSADNRIRAMVLHCARDASEGGENALLDHEIAYIRLRDASSHLIEALMHEEAMIIPENTDKRSAYRAQSVGPVFYLDQVTGALNMRYSARARNIIWRDDANTIEARSMLVEIMRDDPPVIRHKLQPGQGLICNNILHNRMGFNNGEGSGEHLSKRLLYRIRYMNRVGEGLDIEPAPDQIG